MFDAMNVVNILLGFVLMLIMFSIGMTLTLDKFKMVLKQPKALGIGLSIQIVVLPLLAFVICLTSDIQPEWKAGLLILSICPGGTTSNLISYLLKGNTELSVAMTTVNSVLVVFLIPFLGSFILRYFLGHDEISNLNYFDSLLQLLLITTLPVFVGMITKNKLPPISKVALKNIELTIGSKTLKIAYLKLVTITLLGTMFAIKLFANEKDGGVGLTINDIQDLLPTLVLFNVFGLIIGFLISKALRLKQNTSMTIGVEVGLQNTALAFIVIGSFIQNTEIQQPVLVYALFSFWTTALFGLIVRRKHKV
ncbi:MAG: BASS family bile acid:Na+ symporter [Glaciecola sp.]|jgi:BASS family bile acid:Na+ symporter